MRNKGLHRGAEFIRQTKEVLLHPNEQAIILLCKDIGGLRQQEADLWLKRAGAYDVKEALELEAMQTQLTLKVEVLLAELERKMVLKRVFEHLINHRATEVVRDMMDPLLKLQLSHGEGLVLRDIEQYVYA